jgi:urease accessory protein
MKIASKRIPLGQGLAAALVKRASTVTLDWDTRQKSRFECQTDAGDGLGVFLPRGTSVRGSDVLVCEDGSLVKVLAAPQAVLRITACTAHGSPFDLTRAAYHLGNRHVAIELKPDHLKIEPDAVLADMLRDMHLIVNEASEAFEPEGGAYSGGHGHSHGHGHDHAHGHVQGHDHSHSHDHQHEHQHGDAHAPAKKSIPIAVVAATEPHVHGPHCNHGHHH